MKLEALKACTQAPCRNMKSYFTSKLIELGAHFGFLIEHINNK